MTEEVLVDDGDPRIEVRPEALLALVGEHRFTPKEACSYSTHRAPDDMKGEIGVLHVGETLVRVAMLKDKSEPIRLGPFRKITFVDAGGESRDDLVIRINARVRTFVDKRRIIGEILRGPIASGEMAADEDSRDHWMLFEVSRHEEA